MAVRTLVDVIERSPITSTFKDAPIVYIRAKVKVSYPDVEISPFVWVHGELQVTEGKECSVLWLLPQQASVQGVDSDKILNVYKGAILHAVYGSNFGILGVS